MSTRSILLGVSSNCSDALDGRVFASIPFDRDVLEWLKQRTRCFSRQRKPTRISTRPTSSIACSQWYDTTGASKEYDDQADRDKLQRLSYDAELDACEPCRRRLAVPSWTSSRLKRSTWLVVPAEELPSSGNLRTECDQLVMSLRGNTSDIVELRWICYIKHTDVELRTFRDQLRGHRPLAGRARTRRPPCREARHSRS